MQTEIYPMAAKTAATKRRRWRRPRSAIVIQYLILSILLFLTFFTILLMIALSLRPSVLIYTSFWRLPWPPTLSNYRTAVFDLLPAMLRSLFVSITSIAGILLVACPASYAFARMRFPGQGVFYYLVLAVLMIPGIILLTPHFILANQLNLRGTLAGLIIFYIAGGLPFAVFLITTFFRGQAEDYFEAARLDGASEFQALLSIAVPLAAPILVTIAMLNFLTLYSDFIWPSLIVLRSQETLMLALERYNPQVSEFVSRPDIGLQSAGYTVATVPQLVLFALGMRFFIQGLTAGSVKA